MDETRAPTPGPAGAPRRAPQLTFYPDRRAMLAAGVGGLVGVLLTVLSLLNGDRVGGLFGVLIVIVLGGYLFADLIFTPRLVVSAAGVVVRSPLARATLAWPQIEGVRVDTRLRLGLRSTAVEIDAGETLIILGRRSLGADPAEVVELVNAFRPG